MNYLSKAFFFLKKEEILKIWGHAGFQKYFRNTGWMLAARIIGFITSFFTVAIIARYLGPENLGKLEYAQSFIAIISVFASLGIDQILYRDLITANKEEQNELLGTAVSSKLFFGLLAFTASISLSLILQNDFILTLLIGISAMSFVVNPIGSVGILFNSKVKAKYRAQISIFLAFFIPILKILIMLLNKGIIFFAAIIFIETLISTAWSIFIYITKFNGNPLSWRFNLRVFKKIILDSWPLLLAGLSGYIYAKMDQIMLLHYLNSRSVGIYGIAVRLTQVWSFFPGMIVESLFPAIINARKKNFNIYAKRFKILSLATVGLTVIITTPLYIFAPVVVKLIFGSAYIESTPILHIYLWISVAITMVVLVHHYLVAENLGKIFLYISTIGAITNIILNLILIPKFGTKGAAFSTLTSYFMVVLSISLFKKSRNGIIKIFKVKKNG